MGRESPSQKVVYLEIILKMQSMQWHSGKENAKKHESDAEKLRIFPSANELYNSKLYKKYEKKLASVSKFCFALSLDRSSSNGCTTITLGSLLIWRENMLE